MICNFLGATRGGRKNLSTFSLESPECMTPSLVTLHSILDIQPILWKPRKTSKQNLNCGKEIVQLNLKKRKKYLFGTSSQEKYLNVWHHAHCTHRAPLCCHSWFRYGEISYYDPHPPHTLIMHTPLRLINAKNYAKPYRNRWKMSNSLKVVCFGFGWDLIYYARGNSAWRTRKSGHPVNFSLRISFDISVKHLISRIVILIVQFAVSV